MGSLKRWHVVLAVALAGISLVAKAADYLDSRIDERVKSVAVPREDFDRLETKLDHITEILLRKK